MTSFADNLFEFSYNKRKNIELFKDLETTVGISKIQNYIPIYKLFFSLQDGIIVQGRTGKNFYKKFKKKNVFTEANFVVDTNPIKSSKKLKALDARLRHISQLFQTRHKH